MCACAGEATVLPPGASQALARVLVLQHHVQSMPVLFLVVAQSAFWSRAAMQRLCQALALIVSWIEVQVALPLPTQQKSSPTAFLHRLQHLMH